LRKYRDERNRERKKSQEEEGRIKKKTTSMEEGGRLAKRIERCLGVNSTLVVSGVIQAH